MTTWPLFHTEHPRFPAKHLAHGRTTGLSCCHPCLAKRFVLPTVTLPGAFSTWDGPHCQVSRSLPLSGIYPERALVCFGSSPRIAHFVSMVTSKCTGDRIPGIAPRRFSPLPVSPSALILSSHTWISPPTFFLFFIEKLFYLRTIGFSDLNSISPLISLSWSAMLAFSNQSVLSYQSNAFLKCR